MKKYQEVYPSDPIINSKELESNLASDLLTLEYFEADPSEMPHEIFDQHHVLINLNENPHRVENWRGDQHRDFTFNKFEIVVTPAGIKSGWKWHAKSKVIVITLAPEKFNNFALNEVGVVLSDKQLEDIPQFEDEDLTRAAEFLLEALESKNLGYEVVFESLARVFLVKLIQKYGEASEQHEFSCSFTAAHYKRVLDFIKNNYANQLALEDLAKEAGLSPHHFSRLFKSTIGKSPMQFVMSYRLEQAKKMLANHDLTLLDISHRCGFADQAHFSRSFKARYGKSPKSLR